MITLLVALLVSPPDTLQAQVDALVQPYVEAGMFDGVVMLARDGETVWSGAYGMASYEHRVPNTPETRFRVASLSKPLTALAIGVLVERGDLSLDDTLDEWAPQIPRADSIPIRLLLDHTSGVVHINDLPWYEEAMRTYVPLDSLVALIAAKPLLFEPGASRTYSNGGYALLAHIIEEVSGTSYEEALSHLVLAPLGLTNTVAEPFARLVDGLARGYQPGPGEARRIPSAYVAPSVKVGGGSVVSNAADMLRLGEAIGTHPLVTAETWSALLGEGPVYYLSGRAPGYNAVVMRDRTRDATAVVLSNSYAVTANSLAPPLLALVTGGEPARQPLALGSAHLEPLVGAYRWPEPWGTPFEIRASAEGLLVQETDEEEPRPTPLLALEDGRVLLPLYDARCTATPERDLDCTAPWTSQAIRIERVD